MKSIIFISVFIWSILISALPQSRKQTINIKSVIENPNAGLLEKSGQIISRRLSEYGLKNFEISVNPKPGVITVTFDETIDLPEVSELMLSSGNVGLYETFDRTEGFNILDKEDRLNSLLGMEKFSGSSAILGSCKPDVISEVNSYLSKHYTSKTDEGIKFLWSKALNAEGNYSLYLLKQKAALSGESMSETSVNKYHENYELMITFNENGTMIWQLLSKNNIGKPIAIVIDNQVYSAPVLKSEINNGKCSIAGNFSLKELTQLASLINNGELPLEFQMIK